jgi:hypothetical protein
MMETNTQNQMTQEQKKSNVNKILVVIIAILSILCGVLFWQFLEQRKAVKTEITEKQAVTEEKDALSQELENMLSQYDALESDNKQMQSQIDEQKGKIEELMKEVEKNKGNTALMIKFKKETETLRKIMKGYISTIDSLGRLNENLTNENISVKSELGKQQNRYEELNKEKENLSQTVARASILSASNASAVGIFVKGNGKEVESNKAKKIEKIKTCFDLSANNIAKKGSKDVYVRILSPEGKILAEGADESYMFNFDGVKGIYSAKKSVDYQNQRMTVCTYFTMPGGADFPAGKYLAEIYADQTKIGDVGFELK